MRKSYQQIRRNEGNLRKRMREKITDLVRYEPDRYQN